ncbi:MAG: OB-fold domain-containing protein, partial [Desulfobacterales bacterium]
CITIAPPFMIAQGYNRKNPYISGVVELDEGGRVDARIEGLDPNKPEAIKVGMSLKAKYLHTEVGDKKETYLAFEPL